MFARLLLLAALAYTFAADHLPDSLSAESDDSEPHGEDALRCRAMKRVLYGGRCWDLFSKGPCEDGQWLMLNGSDEEEDQPNSVKCSTAGTSATAEQDDIGGRPNDVVDSQHLPTTVRPTVLTDQLMYYIRLRMKKHGKNTAP